MKTYKQMLHDLTMEQALVIGTSAGVVIGSIIAPLTSNAGLTLGLCLSFGAAAGLILGLLATDENI